MRRRLAASASRAWVSSFSSRSSASRAALHSCGDTVGGMFMVMWSSVPVICGAEHRPLDTEIRRGSAIHRSGGEVGALAAGPRPGDNRPGPHADRYGRGNYTVEVAAVFVRVVRFTDVNT